MRVTDWFAISKRREIRRLINKYAPEYKVKIANHYRMPVEKDIRAMYKTLHSSYFTKAVRNKPDMIMWSTMLGELIEKCDRVGGFAYGSTDSIHRIIYINKIILNTDKWKDTVLHEIAHALSPNDITHGEEWQQMYKQLKLIEYNGDE